MSKILSKVDLQSTSRCSDNTVDTSLWTCVIPAAGKGTRLGYNLPKILYPILGESILYHLVGLFQKYCSHFIVVASPEGSQKIQKELESCCNSNDFRIVIQEEPKGMAHAVWQARNATKTPHTVVVWGDQICLRDETISSTLTYHQSNSANVLTFPTVIKRDPYIHFQRDDEGKILKVLQKREKEINMEVGENDCGFFTFSTESLFSVLKNGLKSPVSLGTHTKEVNLLQLFPQFEVRNNEVNTLRIAHEDETLGINTAEEAQTAESVLRDRKKIGK